MNQPKDSDYEMTLDPPGRIAIIGAGPLGIEAALYGRYLGYHITLFEKGEIGQSLRPHFGETLSMLPDRCLSPLAVSALKAHDGGLAFAGDPTYPMTVEGWVDRGLMRIASTDLLWERVLTHHEVMSIETYDAEREDLQVAAVDSESDESESYIDGDVPPDFRLGVHHDSVTHSFDCEAVLVAIGFAPSSSITGLPELEGVPYLFRIGQHDRGSAEASLHLGWHEIVQAYAMLGGRQGLDLYRPIRS